MFLIFMDSNCFVFPFLSGIVGKGYIIASFSTRDGFVKTDDDLSYPTSAQGSYQVQVLRFLTESEANIGFTSLFER